LHVGAATILRYARSGELFRGQWILSTKPLDTPLRLTWKNLPSSGLPSRGSLFPASYSCSYFGSCFYSIPIPPINSLISSISLITQHPPNSPNSQSGQPASAGSPTEFATPRRPFAWLRHRGCSHSATGKAKVAWLGYATATAPPAQPPPPRYACLSVLCMLACFVQYNLF